MAISFATEIRPLFRYKDVASMTRIRQFDLSNHADVSHRAEAILQRLEAGDMPCDGRWAPDKIRLFQQWIADGNAP